MTVEGKRYIVCRNEAEAETDRKDREAIVTALDAQLKRGDKALVGNSAYRRYLRKTADGPAFAIDAGKLAEEARPSKRPQNVEQSRDEITDLDMLVAHFTTKRTARAWLYRDILDRKQINVVSTMLGQWCTNIMHSKVEPMTEVAASGPRHARPPASSKPPTDCFKPQSEKPADTLASRP